MRAFNEQKRKRGDSFFFIQHATVSLLNIHTSPHAYVTLSVELLLRKKHMFEEQHPKKSC